MNPNDMTVRHTSLKKVRPVVGAATLNKICTAGAQCMAVQNDPVAKAALTVLQTRCTTLNAGVSNKEQSAQMLMIAIKGLGVDLDAAGESLVIYEAAVRNIAAGDASIITGSGLVARPATTPEQPLGVVVDVTSKKGKEATLAIVTWPKTAGATSYALQVNFTPQTAGSPYTALGSGTRRTRTVKAPAAGAQFLAQVAAIASDGTVSAWSDAILVTAR